MAERHAPRPIPPHERGAALLTVLLLVAVMAVIAATALDRLMLSTRLAANGAATAQARAWLIAAEAVAAGRIDTLVAATPGQVTLAGGWHDRSQALPLPGGQVTARVRDGGNCFNINSLVSRQNERLVPRPLAETQFARLMTLLGIAPGQAQQIAASSTDWIDSDGDPRPGGAEDATYRARTPGYLPPNRLAADASELRAVAGMDARSWALLRPWLCALPVSDPTAVNVNTLAEGQALLIAMLDPKIDAARARAALATRPADGYGSSVRFWGQPIWGDYRPSADVGEQVKVTTRWFRMEAEVVLGDSRLPGRALIDAGQAPARVVARSIGEQAEPGA